MYKKAFEVRIVDLIRRGRLAGLTRPLSWGYACLIRMRHWLYDHGYIKQNHVSLPVVSIGNLVAGGVGKTQVALLLAEALPDVAILSRGFRGNAEKRKEPLVVSTTCHKAEECGDEPWLLASRLPKAKVIVHRDRYKSALEAERLGAKVLVLDDGMQHRRLFRDLEIVVLGGADPFGGGYFLPRGFLRENPVRLKHADLILFVGKPSLQVKEKVSMLTQAPCVETRIEATEIRLLNGKPIASVKEKKIGLFCAIGNPDRFAASMQALGAHVVASYYLPDHKMVREKELQKFSALCKEKGAEYLFCTEKDWVKLPSFLAQNTFSIGWVKVELKIVKNREAWDGIIEDIIIRAGMKE